MLRSAIVLSQNLPTLQGLLTVLDELGVSHEACQSGTEAMERVMAGNCSALIVDFDLPGAAEVVKMAALLEPPQKPVLLAVASRAWPGTGQAFQSGADRILYKPLDPAQVKDAFESSRQLRARNRRKVARYQMKTVVYLDLDTGTLPAIGIDISEHGFAVQATEQIPLLSKLAFRCVLPGTTYELHGHADVIWASDHGRAGLFFSRISTPARKHLKSWLAKRGRPGKAGMRALRPPMEVPVSEPASEMAE